MPPARPFITAFGVVAVIGLVALFSYNQGYGRARHDERLQLDWNGSKAQTNDAIRRWIQKTNSRGMKERYPFLMAFPDRNCIQLRLEVGGVGGEPVYCYRANTLQLIEEYSDVE